MSGDVRSFQALLWGAVSVLNVSGGTTDPGFLYRQNEAALRGGVHFVEAGGDSERVRPTVSITSPTAGQRWSNAVFVLKGTAKDNVRVDEVRYKLNGEDWEEASTTNRWTNWTATVRLLPGTNLVRVYAKDTSGNRSLTNVRAFAYVLNIPFGLTINGGGTVTPLTPGQPLELGKRYTIKATPRLGNLFSNWVGSVTSTNRTLSFFWASNFNLTANFVTNPFIALRGTYTGLHQLPDEPVWDSSGLFKLMLGPAGTYSGRLYLAGASYSFSGAFDQSLESQKRVLRPGTNELIVSLQLLEGSDQVTGSVSNASFFTQLVGYRSGFSTANPATNLAGKYTAVLSGGGDPVTSPFGQGFATFTVAHSGSVVMKGKLADGTAVAQSTPLAGDGEVVCHATLYSRRGSIFGWLSFTNAPDTVLITGPLLWTKTPTTSGNFYRGGFANTVNTLGSRYTATNKPVLNFRNAVVRLEGGNLSAPLTNDVVLSPLNKVTVAPTNVHRLTLTLSAAAGTFSGTFHNPATGKTSSIKGALLQKQNVGSGFFLGTNQSGRVYFGPPEGYPMPLP
ncbi:MAG TPA: Ig-like domain-containing protein [Verrucomicrobiae bacterium]|nr:Ig-like domain-containing protein [Verrucomicrobiae bacterium]